MRILIYEAYREGNPNKVILSRLYQVNDGFEEESNDRVYHHHKSKSAWKNAVRNNYPEAKFRTIKD